MDQPAMAVFIVNSDGRIVKTNETALRWLDLASEQILGQHYGRFLAVFRSEARLDGEKNLSDPVQRSLATEEPQLNIMGLLYRKGGAAVPFEGAVAPAYEGVDGPRGAVIIVELEDP